MSKKYNAFQAINDFFDRSDSESDSSDEEEPENDQENDISSDDGGSEVDPGDPVGVDVTELRDQLVDHSKKFEMAPNLDVEDYDESDDDTGIIASTTMTKITQPAENEAFELPPLSPTGSNGHDSQRWIRDIEKTIDETIRKVSDNWRENAVDDSADIELVTKHGRVWSGAMPDTLVRREPSNILRANPFGTIPRHAFKKSILETWQLFFPDAVLKKYVLNYTNLYREQRIIEKNSKIQAAEQAHGLMGCSCPARQKCKCFCHKQIETFLPISLRKLKAFIAILYMKGVCKGRNEKLDNLWKNNSTQRPFFSAVMSRDEFREIKKDIRFDDKETRTDRVFDDNLAAIRDLWDTFNKSLLKHFVPSSDITIDEQLILFRGRCRFKIYNKSKPGRYGFLLRWLCDAKNRYAICGLPYVSTPNNPIIAETVKESNRACNVVLHFAELPGIKGSGRNVTMDRLYTDVELAETLYNEYKLTCVGTIMPNRKNVPREILDTRDRDDQSSVFFFSPPVTIVSYVPRRKKNVLLISTMHNDRSIDENRAKKPHIILHYNETKAGVDTIDQMCRHYGSKIATRRWPLVFFFNMLDIAAINAHTIFNKSQQLQKNRKIKRYDFLYKLALSLAANHLKARPLMNLKTYLSNAVAAVTADIDSNNIPNTLDDATDIVEINLDDYQFPSNSNDEIRPEELMTKGSCNLCVGQIKDTADKSKRKRAWTNTTTAKCEKCKKFTCKQHIVKICKNCE